ncbi:MAG: hypothetical protein ABFQ62_02695 [Patescibacteria group bacterium]
MSLDPKLAKIYKLDKKRLEQARLPIVTVSASYKEDLKGFYGMPENEFINDVVFSRAHYSMALAVAIQSCGGTLDPKKSWVVDPTNYVSAKDWRKIQFTEAVGMTIARKPFLKYLKDFIDKFGRSKLPILKSITPPLLYLTQNIKKPILSMHIAAGNILAKQGKQVLQMITDPHVRENYLDNAERKNIKFLVFDERTKFEFLEKASTLHKKINPKRVIVTGPPIDPRIIHAKEKKHVWRSGTLRLCITTGGLGTNIHEIRRVLKDLIPQLRKNPSPYQLLIYAGTHEDIYKMAKKIAGEERVKISHHKDRKAKLRLIYHPQIVDANEILVEFAFPWAHGFISKPSGDMAYDAVASGSFLLTLKEWGEWEHNIREIFEQKNIARRADTQHIVEQLKAITSTYGKPESWAESAMNNAFKIEKLFLDGAKNIVKATKGKNCQQRRTT